MASPENPTQSYLYRVPADGSGQAERVTPLDQPGTHAYQFSPGARWAVHTYSSFGRPPIAELVSLPDHKVVKTLAGNAKLRAKLDALAGDRGEFFRVDIGEGVVLDGWCLKPPGFDPAKKYPVLVHVYGEPAAQDVVDRWGGEIYLWHRHARPARIRGRSPSTTGARPPRAGGSGGSASTARSASWPRATRPRR